MHAEGASYFCLEVRGTLQSQIGRNHFCDNQNQMPHSALKLKKKCNFKSTKTHFLPLPKMAIN